VKKTKKKKEEGEAAPAEGMYMMMTSSILKCLK